MNNPTYPPPMTYNRRNYSHSNYIHTNNRKWSNRRNNAQHHHQNTQNHFPPIQQNINFNVQQIQRNFGNSLLTNCFNVKGKSCLQVINEKLETGSTTNSFCIEKNCGPSINSLISCLVGFFFNQNYQFRWPLILLFILVFIALTIFSLAYFILFFVILILVICFVFIFGVLFCPVVWYYLLKICQECESVLSFQNKNNDAAFIFLLISLLKLIFLMIITGCCSVYHFFKRFSLGDKLECELQTIGYYFISPFLAISRSDDLKKRFIAPKSVFVGGGLPRVI